MSTIKSSPYVKSVTAMQKTFMMLGCPPSKEQVAFLVEEFSRLSKAKGIVQTVRILKSFYAESTRYAVNRRINISNPTWIKRDSENFPLLLKKHFGKDLRSKCLLKRRMALSLLRCYESIEVKPKHDLGNLILPSTGNTYFSEHLEPEWKLFSEKGYFPQFLRDKFQQELSDRRSRNETFETRLHYSTKSGPKGPTAGTAGKQSVHLPTSLSSKLVRLNNHFARYGWKDVLEFNQAKYLNEPDICNIGDGDLPLGRICFIPDKGGKTRMIAIGNYWLQDTLKVIHDSTYKVLRSIKTDGTYGQNEAFESVKYASKRKSVYSYDLTAATDRFPINPQLFVLKFLDEETGNLWGEILSELMFDHQGNKYKYEVGQPMGLYASWSVFTLTHHFLVQYCAWKLRKRYPFEEYRILGDDVAIWDKEVAEFYIRIVQLLGLEVSWGKSFFPETETELSKPCVAEFAKRISYKGREITPVSPVQSKGAWNNVIEFPSFLSWLKTHGYCLESVPGSRIERVGAFGRLYPILVVSIHIWELLRCPFGVFWEILDTEKIEITRDKLYELRFNRIMDQLMPEFDFELKNSDFASFDTEPLDSWDEDEDWVMVGGASGTEQIPELDYFELIVRSRLAELKELTSRLQDKIPSINQQGLIDYTTAEIPYSELEYLPTISREDLLKGITDRRPKRQLIGKLLFELAKQLMRKS